MNTTETQSRHSVQSPARRPNWLVSRARHRRNANFVSIAAHRLAHWTGWNEGTVKVWWKCGKLMVGFKCAVCGKLSGIHESVTNTKSMANSRK